LPVSAEERDVIKIWIETLETQSIGRGDNFFALGGHSLLAIQAMAGLSKLRKQQIPLQLLFKYPVVKDLAEKLPKGKGDKDDLLPTIKTDRENLYKPFPVTQVQQAYLIGRSNLYSLGTVSVYVYAEYDSTSLDPVRLEEAFNRLIARHDALRTVFPSVLEQQILEPGLKYDIPKLDLTELDDKEAASHLETARSELSHQVFPHDVWPLFEIRIAELPDRKRLFLSFDALILDGWSVDILFNEWLQLYEDPNNELSPLKISFRDYSLAVERMKGGPAYLKAKKYWLDRLPSFPLGPKLPLLVFPESLQDQKFARVTKQLPKSQWEILQKRGREYGITPTGLIASLFGEVLHRYGESEHFALNLTLFDRLPIHEDVNKICGDFTSLFLLEMDYRNRKNSFLGHVEQTRNASGRI
jgi:yersiniabactin nonribosomal peptide synthetase